MANAPKRERNSFRSVTSAPLYIELDLPVFAGCPGSDGVPSDS
jgi:hypothetical protein